MSVLEEPYKWSLTEHSLAGSPAGTSPTSNTAVKIAVGGFTAGILCGNMKGAEVVRPRRRATFVSTREAAT